MRPFSIPAGKKRRERGFNWEPRLTKSLLSSNPGGHAFLVADLDTRKHGWLSFIFDEADPEQLELVRWERNWHSRNIWSKFPKGGRKPQEVFQDPLSHQEYWMQSYALDVTVEKNTTVRVEADVDLMLKHEGERVLLFAMDPNLRVSSVTWCLMAFE